MRDEQPNPGTARGGSVGRLAIVLLAAVLITVAIFWQARKAELTTFRSRFENDAAARTALVRQEAEKSRFALESLGWFINGNERVDEKKFRTFAAACLTERKELRALSWVPRVTAAERAGFEERAQQEGQSQFRITERNEGGQLVSAGERGVYYPIRYNEPLQGNEADVGFDVGSQEAVRRMALERARDTGEPSVSHPIQLVQDKAGAAEFVILAPVYREGTPKGSVEERRAALAGFAEGVYQAGGVVSTALREVEPVGVTLVLFDRSAPAETQLIYRWDDALKGGRSWKSILFPSPPRATKAFLFGGRQWSVDIQAGRAYMERYCPISYWLILPAGFLAGLLTMGYLGAILSSRERLAWLVSKRTAELRHIQERLRLVLDAIPVGVHWKDGDSVYLGCNRRVAEDAGLNSPEEIAGKTDFDLPWKGYAGLYRARDKEVIETGQPMLNYEQPGRAVDGRVLCLRQSKLPLRDAKGHIIGVLSAYDDITQRKQAQEALRESEARYRAVVEYSPDGMAVSVEGKLVYVNPAAVRFAGAREAADVLGRSVFEFVPEDYRMEVEKRLAQMMETRLPAPAIEGKLRRLGGEIRDADFMGVPIMYGGKPAILTLFRDMTEHRRRAQALRAIVRATAGSGEAFFRALVMELGKALGVKHALAAIVMRGVPRGIRTVALWSHGEIVENREYKLSGTACADVLGKGLCHYPSDVQSRFPSDKLLVDTHAASYLGVPLHSSSGVAALGLLCVMDEQPMPNSELARSLMTVFADRATSELERDEAQQKLRQSREELRQRAEELETIMGCAPIALWVAHDPQCNVISGNRMANSFDVAGPPANWSANAPSAFRWFRDGRQLKSEELPIQQAAANNVELLNKELELLLQSGRRISLLGSATPLRDENGSVRGCVGAFLDITEQKNAENAVRQARDQLAQANASLELKVQQRTAELLRANERLEELDRLKSQFLATMSHELRTPLNSIIGFTGILRQGFAGPVNEEQKKQLGLVFGSAKHLLSLINDLLDLSRIEAGKVEIQQEAFNFVEVMEEVAETLQPMARQKNLNLSVDLPGPAIDMLGDRKRSFQILLNLANNAVKFTKRGEVKMTARIEGDKLRVCVADTGIGIKPEQMGMLFEAFRQLDGSAKRIYEGTGLGLHLCRKLLTLMQGEITVESKFGKGSRFSFVIPREIRGGPSSQEDI